jgi:hypothetical protein
LHATWIDAGVIRDDSGQVLDHFEAGRLSDDSGQHLFAKRL